MLIEFSIENYRSLKSRVTLSLIAAATKARDEETNANSVIHITERLSLLRGVAIYGANASGKSNVIRAFSTMRQVISRSASYQGEDKIPVEPFVLSPNTQDAPTTLEAVFLINNVQYRYGFTADESRIHAEWLFAVTSSRESSLFTRDYDDEKAPRGISVNRTKFREGVGTEEKTGSNQLFISKVAADQGPIAIQVRDFLVKQCRTVYAAVDHASYTMQRVYDNQEGYCDKIVELVRRLDVDVVDLRVEEEDMPERMHEQMITSGQIPEDTAIAKVRRLFTKHIVRDENGIPVGEAEYDVRDSVSEGTKKIIALAGPIVDSLAKGRVLFVDELDSRLHPKLTRSLLELFLSAETNPNNAQLVFATHDTNLLDRRLLRRDQIYFCEKARDATRLYSLADFTLPVTKGGSRRVRNDASYEADYIEGRYGAVPYLGDIRGLFREEFASLQPDAPL